MVALPAVAVAISAVSAIAGTASAVYGAYQQSQAQQQSAQIAQNNAIAQAQAADYNAQVQRNNAIAQKQQDRLQEEQYFEEAQRKRMLATRQMESARAGLLKSGVTESGTGLDMYLDMATEQSLDAQDSEWRGIIQRWNSKINWNRITSGATLSDYEASSQRAAASYYGSAAKRAGSTMGLNMLIAGGGAALQGATGTFSTYNTLNPPSFRNSTSYSTFKSSIPSYGGF